MSTVSVIATRINREPRDACGQANLRTRPRTQVLSGFAQPGGVAAAVTASRWLRGLAGKHLRKQFCGNHVQVNLAAVTVSVRLFPRILALDSL